VENKTVHTQITALWGETKVALRETRRAVTPFGGLVVFFESLRRVGYLEAVSEHLPFALSSPNTIDPVHTFTAFLLSGLAGARRFAHASLLRADAALHQVLGMKRFPPTTPFVICSSVLAKGSASVFSRGCGTGYSHGFRNVPPGTAWTWTRRCWKRYGRQQGTLRGPNPRKPGRPSHHPLVAVLAEAHFLLHGWLRSGNCGTARGVVEFLKEGLALLPENHSLRGVRADAGFFDQQLLGFLEQRGLHYIVVARLTRWLKREAARIPQWRALDEPYAVGEFSL